MTQAQEQSRTLRYDTLIGFFVIGIITVLLGQILPILSGRLQLNDAEAGTLFLAQFTGSMTGTFFSSSLARRFGFVRTTVVGLLFLLAGLPGINAAEFAVCWGAIFVYGIGIGITIPSVNLLTIEATPRDKQASAVNLINFCWGIGAICSQPFVAIVSGGETLVPVTIILEIALLILAVLFFSASRSAAGAPIVADEVSEAVPTIWKRPAAWLFLLFSFFVISIEGGLGGWLTTYSADLASRGVHGINATVVFFSFFVLGRGLASVISRRISENALISICSTILLAGVVMIVVSEALAVAGAAIAGLGASAIFPTNMVRFTKAFGSSATRQAAPLFIAGILGAATVSWSVGVVSHYFGSLRMGIVVVLASATAVVILQWIIATIFPSDKLQTSENLK